MSSDTVCLLKTMFALWSQCSILFCGGIRIILDESSHNVHDGAEPWLQERWAATVVEVVAWRNGNPVYIDMCPLSWDAFNILLKLVERQCPKRKLVLQKKQMSKQLDTGIVHEFVKSNRKLIPRKKQIAHKKINSPFLWTLTSRTNL